MDFERVVIVDPPTNKAVLQLLCGAISTRSHVEIKVCRARQNLVLLTEHPRHLLLTRIEEQTNNGVTALFACESDNGYGVMVLCMIGDDFSSEPAFATITRDSPIP